MKTNLHTLTGQTPLLMQYTGQHQPQNAYVEIYSDGSVFYAYNPEIGDSTPSPVRLGRVRRIGIPNYLTLRGYRQLHDSISPALDTVIAGMGEMWDGSNLVGTLTDEALEAMDEVVQDSSTGNFDSYEFDEQALAEFHAATIRE